jgi:riboflavin synthase
MFTGIISSVGIVKKISRQNNNLVYTVIPEPVYEDITLGESISINGCCQTVEQVISGELQFSAIPETLLATNFETMEEGQRVNMERALAIGDRLGGHLVQGHIEATATVSRLLKNEGYWDIELAFQSEFIIPKGSVSIDGISLTIQEVTDSGFRVQIIPETVKRTAVSTWYHGYTVNLEMDYLLKAFDYIDKYRSKLKVKGSSKKKKKKKR